MPAPAGPRALAYNPAENAVLVQTDVEGGSYELYQVPKDAAGREVAPVSWETGRHAQGAAGRGAFLPLLAGSACRPMLVAMRLLCCAMDDGQ